MSTQEKANQFEELLKLLEELKNDIHNTTYNTGHTRPNSWNSDTKQRWEGLIDQSTNKVQDYSKNNDLQSQHVVDLENENSTLKEKIKTLEKRLKLLSLISESNDEQVDELMTELANKKFFDRDNHDRDSNEGNNDGQVI